MTRLGVIAMAVLGVSCGEALAQSGYSGLTTGRSVSLRSLTRADSSRVVSDYAGPLRPSTFVVNGQVFRSGGFWGGGLGCFRPWRYVDTLGWNAAFGTFEAGVANDLFQSGPVFAEPAAPVMAPGGDLRPVEASDLELARLQVGMGAYDEAARLYGSAGSMEPSVLWEHALTLSLAGRHLEAAAVLRGAYDAEPEFGVPDLGGLRVSSRDLGRAARGAADEASRGRSSSAWLLASALSAAAGREAVAVRQLEAAETAGLEAAVVSGLRSGMSQAASR